MTTAISLHHRCSACLLFALALAQFTGRIGADGSAALPGSAEADFPGLWVSDLFYQALANFTPRNVGSSACRKQTEMYDRQLRNYTSWAVKMAESWERYPIGVLAGNIYHMGIYDECVGVQYPVRGQYCLSEIKLSAPAGKDYTYNRTEYQDYYGNNHAWHTVLGWAETTDQYSRNILNLGICIPDSCTALDLQSSLQTELNRVFNPGQLKATVKVDPIMCTVSGDMYPRTQAYYMTWAIFLLVILICAISTLHHLIKLSVRQIKKETNEIPESIFYSFSIIKSARDLLKYDKNNELNVLNGFKFVTMIFILFGHRFMYLMGGPNSHSPHLENIYLYGPDILLTSMNLVDPFFFMSGYLMYVTLSPMFEKVGPVWMKLILPLAYRVLRMLPAYCAVMAIVAYIVPHLGDGPLWPQKTWEEAENCQNYWWANLLFISNFIDVKHQCLIVSWYISCDIHFFIIGLFIIYLYMKNVKYGTSLLVVMLVTSISVPFIFTYMTKGEGLLKVLIPFLQNPRSSVTFDEAYRPSYMRAFPYFCGIAASFIVNKMKDNKFRLSQMTVFGGTFCVTVLCIWLQLYGAIFYKRNRPYYPLEQALYSTLKHCTWSVMATWVSICYFTVGYGPISKLLDNRITTSLGRLSYSVFLVNLTVMMMSQSTQREPVYNSLKTSLDAWIYDTFKCYLMGLALHMTIEAPFGNLIRTIFGRGKKKNPVESIGLPIEETAVKDTSKKDISHL